MIAKYNGRKGAYVNDIVSKSEIDSKRQNAVGDSILAALDNIITNPSNITIDPKNHLGYIIILHNPTIKSDTEFISHKILLNIQSQNNRANIMLTDYSNGYTAKFNVKNNREFYDAQTKINNYLSKGEGSWILK